MWSPSVCEEATLELHANCSRVFYLGGYLTLPSLRSRFSDDGTPECDPLPFTSGQQIPFPGRPTVSWEPLNKVREAHSGAAGRFRWRRTP